MIVARASDIPCANPQPKPNTPMMTHSAMNVIFRPKRSAIRPRKRKRQPCDGCSTSVQVRLCSPLPVRERSVSDHLMQRTWWHSQLSVYWRTELVTDRETRQKWTHQIERVCGDDPLQLGLINVEVLTNGRQRDEDSSGVRGLRPTPSVKVAVRRHVDVIESVRRVGREDSSEYV